MFARDAISIKERVYVYIWWMCAGVGASIMRYAGRCSVPAVFPPIKMDVVEECSHKRANPTPSSLGNVFSYKPL